MLASADPTLELAGRVRAACEAHAHAAAPDEACGVIVWHGQLGTGYVPAHNAAANRNYEFVVDLHDAAWDVLLEAEDLGRVRLGLWHSHARGRAHPSKADLAGLDKQWHGRPYALYSVADDAWWLGRVLPRQ